MEGFYIENKKDLRLTMSRENRETGESGRLKVSVEV